MGKTEHRISYKAGVTRTPSDFLCAEGELAECINMASDHEELKTVPPLEGLFTFPAVPDHGESAQAPYITRITRKLLYVHKYNNQERYVIWQQTEWSGGKATERDIRWGTVEDGQYVPAQEYFPPSTIGDIILPGFYEDYVLFDDPGTATVTCIGKTLMFNTEEGLKYVIWKDDGYVFYDGIPEPEIEFALSKQSASGQVSLFTNDNTITWETFVEDTSGIDGSIFVPSSGSTLRINIKNQAAYNDLMIGLYAKQKKNIAEKKAFSLPFFIRTAVELQDGSYTYISQPILMFPSVTRNAYCDDVTYNGGEGTGTFKFRTELSYLYYRSRYDYSDLSDIVKGVKVFVSAPIEINNVLSDLPNAVVPPQLETVFDRIVGNNYQSVFEKDTFGANFAFHPFNRRDIIEVTGDITSTSVFYQLASIGMTGTGMTGTNNGWKPMAERFGSQILVNITTQDQLKYDDYYSRSPLQAEMMYAYNSRLNLASLSRGFFDGFSFFLPYDNPDTSTYVALVRIKTDSGNRIAKKRFTTKQKQGIWFYYPDARAEWVTIWRDMSGSGYTGWQLILDAKLTEHEGLNGAYYFRGFPTSDYVEGSDYPTPESYPSTAIPYDTTADVTPEYLPNQIATSEVNNPFVFLAKGYNTVGTGRIIGMATQTHPLSPGQYGYAPLIVFTDEGLWAMSVDRTGLYNNVDPMPREVCVNPRSIIQTDDSVLFVSKKGLMVIKGRDVSCVSTLMDGRGFDTQLVDCLTAETLGSDVNSDAWAQVVSSAADDGMSFQTFLSEALVAYDYIDRRVLLLHPSMPYCWSWSMRDGGFTKLILPARITNVVGNYPDYILQDADVNGRTYAFYGKIREEDVSERQRGFLLTRPLKLSGPVGVSSLRELLNVGCWDKEGGSAVKSQVLVSDDLHRWYVAGSRFGAAAKYFRIALFVYMLPSERLSGTIVREQERRSDNARG